MYRTKEKITLPNGVSGYHFYLFIKGTGRYLHVFETTIRAGKRILKEEMKAKKITKDLLIDEVPSEDLFLVKL